MTIHFIERTGQYLPAPPQDALIVCAGTITCETVNDMRSGFLLFKDTFNFAGNPDWVQRLNQALDAYHAHALAMPRYQRIAKNEHNQLGAIATVPIFHGTHGLDRSQVFASYEERIRFFQQEYKNAVHDAILDAKTLNRPLYIQPLGIGVYGWQSHIAAQLFSEAIQEADPNNEVTIHIPIYHPKPHTVDGRFQKFLTERLADRVIKPARLIEPTIIAPEQEIPSPATQSKSEILHEIVTTLIGNIEQGRNDRLTNGSDSPKLRILREIQENIATLGDQNDDEIATQIGAIEAACKIKRHWYHFWSMPHSVNEFHALLARAKLSLPVQLEQNPPQ